jgi:hypothetical protein
VLGFCLNVPVNAAHSIMMEFNLPGPIDDYGEGKEQSRTYGTMNSPCNNQWRQEQEDKDHKITRLTGTPQRTVQLLLYDDITGNAPFMENDF